MKVDPRLKEISPLWAERIEKVKTLHGLLKKKEAKEPHLLYTKTRMLNIEKFEACMVGEAFGFDNVYDEKSEKHELNCKKCKSISQRVVYPVRNSHRIDSLRYFQRVIKEFCNHIERDHGVILQW